MKQFYIVLALSLITILSGCRHTSTPADAEVKPPPEPLLTGEVPANADSVWVCESPGSKKYHFAPDCGGMKRCRHDKQKRTIKDAEAIGLTACSKKKCNN